MRDYHLDVCCCGHGRTARVAPILVWAFDGAPAEYRDLSPHGGDEDWLAVIPPGVEVPWWTESGTRFAVCDASATVLPDGRTVVIGAHA